jgi:curli production assembly/transport component CsgG
MVTQRLYLCLLVTLLSSCAVVQESGDLVLTKKVQSSSTLDLQSEELRNLPPAQIRPTIAIYPNSFRDLTGQRRSNSTFALFSTAVTQAPEAFLIRAFKHTAGGKFFRVVERVGLDDLTKERQLIRSTRKDFKEDNKMQPLLFAGLLVQGGVISYEANLKSGGSGARYLGIGTSKQFREDTVTISLRLVSVSTGEVLMETLVSKSILSTSVSQDVFRFIETGTELVEIEGGISENESVSIALQKAVETGVLNIINIGIERGYWKYEQTKIIKPDCTDVGKFTLSDRLWSERTPDCISASASSSGQLHTLANDPRRLFRFPPDTPILPSATNSRVASAGLLTVAAVCGPGVCSCKYRLLLVLWRTTMCTLSPLPEVPLTLATSGTSSCIWVRSRAIWSSRPGASWMALSGMVTLM